MKKLLSALLIAVFVLACRPAAAQSFQFSQPTYLFAPTNCIQVTGSPLASNIFNVTLPPLSLSFSGATNPNTTVTNIIVQTITFTNSIQFIYNAGVNGTNFTTNFNNGGFIGMFVTNQTVGWAFPQSGGSNTCFVK